jgi:phage repressor protein C with HTH and peptisase S24 domain
MRDVLGVESDYKLAKELGKSTSALSNWRKRGSIPIDECISLSVSHGVSLDWLIFGKGEAIGSTGQTPAAYRVDDGAPLAAATGPGPGLAEVKLYDVEGAAGGGRSLEGERVEGVIHFPEAELAALGVSAARVAGVKVRGDSMDDTLADGDWVLVDLDNRDPRRSGVFLLWQSGERRIKRVQRLPGGALQLISDNTHYPPEMVTPEEMGEVAILGRCEVRIGRVS